MKLFVLISGSGTGSNLKAILHAIKTGKLAAKVVLVVSDSEGAKGLQIARQYGVPTHVLLSGESLDTLSQNISVDLIVLTGWKKIIPDSFIDAFPNKILNIHPGLIPDIFDGVVLNPDGTKALWNKGKFAQKALQTFLDNHATYAGSTVHALTHEFDFGPVFGRCFEKVLLADTAESLYKRLKQKENALLVDVLKNLEV